MTVYRITGFSEGPHWSVAYIEAASAATAMDVLAAKIGKPDNDSFDRPDTVWDVNPREEWVVAEADRPLVFVLGAGCR